MPYATAYDDDAMWRDQPWSKKKDKEKPWSRGDSIKWKPGGKVSIKLDHNIQVLIDTIDGKEVVETDDKNVLHAKKRFFVICENLISGGYQTLCPQWLTGIRKASEDDRALGIAFWVLTNLEGSKEFPVAVQHSIAAMKKHIKKYANNIPVVVVDYVSSDENMAKKIISILKRFLQANNAEYKKIVELGELKGKESEDRFFAISQLLIAQEFPNVSKPFWMIGLEKSTVEEDEFQGIDFWILTNLEGSERIPMQIKSSSMGMNEHLRKYGEHIPVIIVTPDIDDEDLAKKIIGVLKTHLYASPQRRRRLCGIIKKIVKGEMYGEPKPSWLAGASINKDGQCVVSTILGQKIIIDLENEGEVDVVLNLEMAEKSHIIARRCLLNLEEFF